ncbi:MAG: hypothetical protein P4L87_00955 [Formivibrio sp.]|nr:hypothetical protein [Formivibrio sp.]
MALAAASKTRLPHSDFFSFAFLAAFSISATSDGSILKINRPALEVPFGIGGLPRFLCFGGMVKKELLYDK